MLGIAQNTLLPFLCVRGIAWLPAICKIFCECIIRLSMHMETDVWVLGFLWKNKESHCVPKITFGMQLEKLES
jgi:hypothetical protein